MKVFYGLGLGREFRFHLEILLLGLVFEITFKSRDGANMIDLCLIETFISFPFQKLIFAILDFGKLCTASESLMC